MARLFGTDGVRGVANKELTCETAFKLGQAAVAFQGKTILIGKDTRLSGDMLESAVASGIMSMGGTALLAGIIPTPAIALLVRELHCDGGIVISASHNPPEYDAAIDHLRDEAADVVYHLLVVLERYGIGLDEFAAELNNRMTDAERPEGGVRLHEDHVKRVK